MKKAYFGLYLIFDAEWRTLVNQLCRKAENDGYEVFVDVRVKDAAGVDHDFTWAEFAERLGLTLGETVEVVT